MKLAIPLDEMTTAEKLQAIEEIWADLQRAPDEICSPGWHADVLAARENRVREGKSHFSPWAEAKSRIHEKV
jgi:Putative addiction module component